MRLIIGMFVVLGFFSLPADAHEKCSKAECAVLKEKIRTIERKRRAGYTRAQGERYAAQLRELKARRSKICR